MQEKTYNECEKAAIEEYTFPDTTVHPPFNLEFNQSYQTILYASMNCVKKGYKPNTNSA